MPTAIVSQTGERAHRLAWVLGVGGRSWAFGPDDHMTFEGLRVDRVLVDADAQLPDDFLDAIFATVAKTPGGQVVRVSATRLTREDF